MRILLTQLIQGVLCCLQTADHGYLLIPAFFQALQSYSWGFVLIQSVSELIQGATVSLQTSLAVTLYQFSVTYTNGSCVTVSVAVLAGVSNLYMYTDAMLSGSDNYTHCMCMAFHSLVIVFRSRAVITIVWK